MPAEAQPLLRVLSLGAGVQSTAMALMAAHGELGPMPDCAIFADTGAEPESVYQHLTWLRSPNVLPFPVHIVSAGNLRDDIMDRSLGKKATWGRPPFFAALPGGKNASLRRQCTRQYKIEPIIKEVRVLLGLKRHSPGPVFAACETWIGISTDEAARMKPSAKRYIGHRWPLIEARLSRGDCLRWLERHGYPIPGKSACVFCPYHSDDHWRRTKAADPASFAQAVAVDRAIRHWPGQTAGELFVHRSLQPLDAVDLRDWSERGQPDLFQEECEGMCGV